MFPPVDAVAAQLRYFAGGIGAEGSLNIMNFIPWKKMLGGYQSSVGRRLAKIGRAHV